MHPPKLYANLCEPCDSTSPATVCFHDIQLNQQELEEIAGFYRAADEMPLSSSNCPLYSEEHARAFLKDKKIAVDVVRLLNGLSAADNSIEPQRDFKGSFVSCGNAALVGSTASQDVRQEYFIEKYPPPGANF
jgi:hypothetical protein